jgi:hypothetical protein
LSDLVIGPPRQSPNLQITKSTDHSMRKPT